MKRLALIMIFLWLAIGNAAYAEQMQQFGDFEVHYNVVNTSFLPAQVAKAYGIVRSNNRVLLNIAVRKKLGEHETSAQKAGVSGVRNDLMREYPLEFTEIMEQNAVYYISEFKIINEEFSRFTIDIEVSPQQRFTLKFDKTLYLDK